MSEIMDQYNSMCRYLGIDVLDIEGQFATVPRIIQQAAELWARANRNLALAKHNIDVAEANAAADIRMSPLNGKTPGQTTIDSMVPRDPDVQAAIAVWRDVQYEVNVCEKLHRTLEGQWIMMHKVADLTISGYFNPGVLPDSPNREALRRAREEADIRRAEQSRPPRSTMRDTVRTRPNRRYMQEDK